MRVRRLLGTLLAGSAIVLSGCGDDSGEGDEPTTSTEEADEATTTTEDRDPTTTEVTPEGGDDATTTTVDEEAVALEEAWRANAVEHREDVGDLVDFDCPGGGEFGTVWGSDPYTDDSSVCTAGVHAGVITQDGGGTVVVEILGEQASYTGSTANGVESFDYGEWPGSFRVVQPG